MNSINKYKQVIPAETAYEIPLIERRITREWNQKNIEEDQKAILIKNYSDLLN